MQAVDGPYRCGKGLLPSFFTGVIGDMFKESAIRQALNGFALQIRRHRGKTLSDSAISIMIYAMTRLTERPIKYMPTIEKNLKV